MLRQHLIPTILIIHDPCEYSVTLEKAHTMMTRTEQ